MLKTKKKEQKAKVLGPNPNKIRKLAKKLNVKGNIDISTRETWFSRAMDTLEKNK